MENHKTKRRTNCNDVQQDRQKEHKSQGRCKSDRKTVKEKRKNTMTISKATVATLQKICKNKNITKNKSKRQNNNPTKLVINIMKMATQASRGQKKKSRAIKIENHKTKRRTD